METLILTSAGIESTVAVAMALKNGERPYLLHFSLGRKSDINELHYVNYQSTKLRLPSKLIDLTAMQNLFSGVMEREWLFSEGDVACPSEVSFLPGLIELSILFAKQAGLEKISVGLTKEQLPKERLKSIELLQESNDLFHSKFIKVKIELPFAHQEKSEVIKLGESLKVDFQQSWSCLEGNESHCGVCQSCVSRKTAFKKAGVEDPTKYQKHSQ